jgi:hypothetical protein
MASIGRSSKSKVFLYYSTSGKLGGRSQEQALVLPATPCSEAPGRQYVVRVYPAYFNS